MIADLCQHPCFHHQRCHLIQFRSQRWNSVSDDTACNLPQAEEQAPKPPPVASYGVLPPVSSYLVPPASAFRQGRQSQGVQGAASVRASP